MISLPPHKIFLIKYNYEVYQEIVSRFISSAGGKVSAVGSLEELSERLSPASRIRKSLGGIVYGLGPIIPRDEQERQIKRVRSLSGDNIPLLVTYCRRDEVEEDYNLALTGERISDYGADTVLFHPFSGTEFYAALGKALDVHKFKEVNPLD